MAPPPGAGESQRLAWISSRWVKGPSIHEHWTLPVGEDAEVGRGGCRSGGRRTPAGGRRAAGVRRRTPGVVEGAASGQGSSDGRVVGCGLGREGIKMGRDANTAGVSGGRRASV
jgi:hypothetical protein